MNDGKLDVGSLIVVVLVAALVGFATGALKGSPARGSATAPTDTADLNAKLEQLEASLGELRGQQARLQDLAQAGDGTGAETAASRAPVEDLETLVGRWLDERVASGELLASATGPAGSQSGESGIDHEVDAVLDQLLSGELSGAEEDALWQKLRDEDRIDAVVAAIEELAQSHPNDPDLQVDLAGAYVQKIFDVGVGPMSGVFSEKADKAYDRALALDDHHWEARFGKAISLSNWPDFLGKSGEAIRQFETLIEQQEQRTPQDQFAQSYFFLGNMHQKNGEAEKARAAWQRGLDLFPNNESLRRQLETSSR